MHKFLIRTLALGGLFLASNFAHAAFYKPSTQVYTVKTPHFYIHYEKNAADVARDLIELVEPVHNELAKKFNWVPKERTHVVLVDKSDMANGLTTVLPADYMLLFVSPPDADSSLDSYKNYLKLLFTHEYTHMLHIDQNHRWAKPLRFLFGKIVAPNGLTPGWMREGIAVWAESDDTDIGRNNSAYVEMIIRNSVLENQFPQIDEIDSGRLAWPAGNASYYWGGKFFEYLGKKYGEPTIQKYAEKYSSGLWLFSLNNKAKKIYGKSFYQLWQDWKLELTQKYSQLKADLTSKGLTPFVTELKDKRDVFGNYTPHPLGVGAAYTRVGNDEDPQLILTTKIGAPPTVLKRGVYGQMAFSRDGGKLLAFSGISLVEKYDTYAEIFVYDIDKQKLSRVYDKKNPKLSMRATDPDFSPLDGGNRWIVMVKTWMGTDNLYVYDWKNKVGYYLTDATKYTQFSNPRFSPDGKYIVVSRRLHEKNRDLVLYTKDGQVVKEITNDLALDNHPIWSHDGQNIYYSSDKSGIPNIYRYDVAKQISTQVSNVLTGVYQPALSADGKILYAKYYTSQGPAIYKVSTSQLEPRYGDASFEINQSLAFSASLPDLPREPSVDSYFSSLTSIPITSLPLASANSLTNFESGTVNPAGDVDDAYVPLKHVPVQSQPSSFEMKDLKETTSGGYENELKDNPVPQRGVNLIPGSKKYNAFPQVLIPRYIVPTFATLDDAFLYGVSVGRFDPMYRHSWFAGANYRSDAGFIGAAGSYSYTRYAPTFTIGGSRYAVNWGDLFDDGVSEDFFEQRLQGYAGISLATGHHAIAMSYFFEQRDNLSDIPSGFSLPNLDYYAGIHTAYTFNFAKTYPNSIGLEEGPYLKLMFDVTDALLGSAQVNEQKVFTGDLRYYLEMPWSNHHVLALRAAGGYVWGDEEFSGSFRFGGPFGEGNLAGYSARLFPLRGLPGVTYSGDRVMLFSGEYRLPLVTVDGGIGTWPIFLRHLHMAFFGDYGDSWARNAKVGGNIFDNFFLGIGSELKGDFVIGYGLPVTARLGYAIIVLNRDQIVGLEDSLLGTDLRNGTVYLQFGSSF
ncbi:MAG: hypothetical protein A3G32_09770 [Deltaproteobacteria bacterium RIFCSPLOWO2_12_FULL_40_28]|nr:MAG: hypothetical protein A3C45_04205 [Deltaproteobacteria bacterium RIFCSPHIGHO2_02_FULL_40_28]OGQ21074.1 MAG: hypothetical protein A3E27_00110 [Deltaproteobacteria bacterium RIFCSPHIGHO2_12_FULL_40_32]OGQ38986.1 MAG: hypothetical protein A3I69_07640 [Deltaproteobacteria bacterium RIFCSPLOWO2_02_FULL_40_36]OGQ53040.1 MAG: hypothetical protein A3G32_09770 [Deltaproteobacteria bacterium RIFCSPLOWO2_12_FULL_40_28]